MMTSIYWLLDVDFHDSAVQSCTTSSSTCLSVILTREEGLFFMSFCHHPLKGFIIPLNFVFLNFLGCAKNYFNVNCLFHINLYHMRVYVIFVENMHQH